MNWGTFIKNTVAIGGILGMAFLSQQPLFASNTKNYAYSQGAANKNKMQTKLQDANTWLQDNVYAKVSAGVSGGVTKTDPAITSVKKEIENQKNNLLQNSFDTSKKIIATQILKILQVSPQDLDQCKTD